jgi:chromosome segregation ATPase
VTEHTTSSVVFENGEREADRQHNKASARIQELERQLAEAIDQRNKLVSLSEFQDKTTNDLIDHAKALEAERDQLRESLSFSQDELFKSGGLIIKLRDWCNFGGFTRNQRFEKMKSILFPETPPPQAEEVGDE